MSRGFVRIIAAMFAVTVIASGHARARDLGQWADADPRVSFWYKNLKQPDNPAIGCCGEADAYFADEFEVEGDQYVAIVTDTRDDAPLRRPHVEPGTRILIPRDKVVHEGGNPTGHGVVFYSAGAGVVHCYVPPGGV